MVRATMKKAITIKVEPDLMARLDRFQAKLPFPATRTGLIETAIEQMLSREEKKGERR
jgi:predicted transcriptional regulator